MTPDAISKAFAALGAAGFPRPETYKTDQGMAEAVAVWMLVLQDITPEELDVAVFAWAQRSEPWWPKPGQLLDLVPHVQASKTAFDLLYRPRWRESADRFAGHLIEHVGGIDEARSDRRRFEQLYRRMNVAWTDMLPTDRAPVWKRLGEDRTSRVALLLPSAVTDALEGADLSPRLSGDDSQQRRRLLKVVEEHGR